MEYVGGASHSVDRLVSLRYKKKRINYFYICLSDMQRNLVHVQHKV